MSNDYGYVYCMTNEAMPNLCKVGYVNIGNTSHSRAITLSASTSIPLPFIVEFDIKVKNPCKYEKILHTIFDSLNYRFKKEFFKCTVDDIINFFNYDAIYKYDKTADINDFAVDYLTIYNKNNNNIVISDDNIHVENEKNIIQSDIQKNVGLNIIDKSDSPNNEIKKELSINKKPDIYNCIYCDKVFKSYNSMNNHYRLVHRDEHKQKRREIINQPKVYKCNICGIVLNNKSAKYRHIEKCKEMTRIANEKINNIQKIKNEPDLNNKIDKLIDLITILKNTKFNT